MKGEKKPVGLLLGIGRPKPASGEYDVPEDDAMESDDGGREAMVTAMRAFLSAVKGNDPEGMADAYEVLKEC